MGLFFKTMIEGIKQGVIAAWYDMKWYIIIMVGILVAYLLFSAVKSFIARMQKEDR